jgi:hypothetical protein
MKGNKFPGCSYNCAFSRWVLFLQNR